MDYNERPDRFRRHDRLWRSPKAERESLVKMGMLPRYGHWKYMRLSHLDPPSFKHRWPYSQVCNFGAHLLRILRWQQSWSSSCTFLHVLKFLVTTLTRLLSITDSSKLDGREYLPGTSYRYIQADTCSRPHYTPSIIILAVFYVLEVVCFLAWLVYCAFCPPPPAEDSQC